VLFPSWITFLTTWTGIRDQENAVFAIMIGILLFMVFHLLVRIEALQKRMTDMVRHQALKEAGLGTRDYGLGTKDKGFETKK